MLKTLQKMGFEPTFTKTSITMVQSRGTQSAIASERLCSRHIFLRLNLKLIKKKMIITFIKTNKTSVCTQREYWEYLSVYIGSNIEQTTNKLRLASTMLWP